MGTVPSGFDNDSAHTERRYKTSESILAFGAASTMRIFEEPAIDGSV